MADGTSLRDTIAAAMKGDEGGEGAPVVDPVAVVAAQEGAEAAAQSPPSTGEAEQGHDGSPGAPERDDKGRFKPKTDTEAQAGAESPPAAPDLKTPAAAASPEPQETETIRVPHALPAPLKAKFKELPAEWRDAFTKQEDSIAAFKDEQAPKAARLKRFDEILGPHLDRWRFNGLDEFSGVQTLLAAQNILERNPVEGLVHIARSYGVSPAHLAQVLGAAPGQAQTTAPGGQQASTSPDLSAALAPLVSEIQTLKQGFQRQSADSEAREIASVNNEVAKFRADPKHLYFDNVRDRMGHLIATEQAQGLEDAYEMAIWADPAIRAILIAEQAKPASPTPDPARERVQQEQRKAAQAQQAAGSVTGAPAPGAQAPPGPVGSVRDSIRAAMQEVSGAV
jgi:hypothetical protein